MAEKTLHLLCAQIATYAVILKKKALIQLKYVKQNAWVEKVPQYPNPVASSISSRVMVELGVVTSFVYVGTVYAIWPIAKSFLTVPLEVVVGVLERMGDVILDMFIYGHMAGD
ncbi:hypothetical protein R6Q59_023827 [Mikania micrantha]